MKRLGRPISVIALTLLALALYAFWLELSRLRVVDHDVAVGGDWATPEHPLRIAVIADLHAGAPYIDEAKIERVVALTNAQRPDLILLTGDYVIQGVVGGNHISIERTATELNALSAPLGVFAVIGNHDRWENAEHIRRVLESVGIRVLEDRSVKIVHNDRSFHLVGLSDVFTAVPKIASALADVPEDGRALCFTHSPDIFPALPEACALTIAGHTHGGQLWLPLIGPPVVPSQYGQRYAAGLVRENRKVLFVSTGIGTSIIPIRFGVVPEISMLKIM